MKRTHRPYLILPLAIAPFLILAISRATALHLPEMQIAAQRPDAPAIACLQPPSGLVGWWAMDGNGNDQLAANNATLFGSPAFPVGKVGQALQFDGVDDYATVSASASIDVGTSNGFTIDLWINPSDIATSRPLVEWSDSAGNFGVHLWQSVTFGGAQGPGNLYSSIIDTNGVSHIISSAPNALVANTYQHVALTYDKTAGTATLYVNGAEAFPTAVIGSFTPKTMNDLYFGWRPASSSRYEGQMDEVELFNRALSRLEIQAIFNAGSAGKCKTSCIQPPSNLISWWPMDGNANDFYGLNSATLSGASFVTGKVDRAMQLFGGFSSYARVNASPSLDVGVASGFTIDLWIQPSSVLTQQPLVEWNNGATQGAHLWIAVPVAGGGQGSLFANLKEPSGANHLISSAPNLVIANTFQHVALTYNQITGVAALYINGTAVFGPTSVGSFTPQTSFDLYFGLRPSGESYVGLMDEIEVLNRELSGSEIQAIYNAGSAGKCKTRCVTNIGDNGGVNPPPGAGTGTLRQVLVDGNAYGGFDTICFNIPGSGVKTISPESALPIISHPVFIDGWTQGGPGYSGPPLIELNGTNAGVGSNGLTLNLNNSSSSAVRGLVINRFSQYGIYLGASVAGSIVGCYIGTNAAGTAAQGNGGAGVVVDFGNGNAIGGTTPSERNIISGNFVGISINTSASNFVRGNFIGTNVSGTAALGNLTIGVNVAGSSNTIGGTVPGARNIISGNASHGIGIQVGTNNLVQGNFIGTDVTGTVDLGNVSNGVFIFNGGNNNTAGGTTAAARNVISGNNNNGVSICGACGGGPASGNLVQGNFIGTDLTGTIPLGNSSAGIRIQDATNNTIGGSTPTARNVIAANGRDGVDIVNVGGPAATGNIVQSNYIGTDVTGTAALGNGEDGVFVLSFDPSFLPSNNTIGGGVGLGNLIAFNGLTGVTVGAIGFPAGSGNAVLANSIFSNGALGIDLNYNFVTANDPLDADTGPNNLQNFPDLIAAVNNGSITTVYGALNSTPNSTFTLEFFSNPSCDPRGYGQGRTFLGTAVVTTGTDGYINYAVTLPPASVGQAITATATNNTTRDTSEFSACRPVTAGSPTAVDDPEFSATRYDDGVLLEWRTEVEVNNLGFNLYRDEEGKQTLVNPQLIAGSALIVGAEIVLGSGSSYQWWDGGPTALTTRYWLEDRDLNGYSRWHGPFYLDDAQEKQRPARVNQAKALASLASASTDSGPEQTRASLSTGNFDGLLPTAFTAARNFVRLAIKQEGWYRITQPELAAAGFDTSVDPNRLQLIVDGRQQAVSITGEDDGRFDLDDVLEFYATGVESPYSDSRTYFLIVGSDPGKRITRIKTAGPPVFTGSFASTVERRDRLIYFSALRNGERENFFGSVISSHPVNQLLTVNHLDSAAAQMATLNIALQGVTIFEHFVSVQLNGIDVGQLSFLGQTRVEQSFSIPQAQLREGVNQVILTAHAPSDVSLVDFIRITYQHQLIADDDELRWTAPGGQATAIGGFSSQRIRVFDVMDPYAVVEIEGELIKHDNGTYGVALKTQGTGQRQLLAVTTDRLKRVASLSVGSPSNWRQYPGADFLIITHNDFLDAALRLKAARERAGFAVAVVDVCEIYDEFSYGQKSPRALREFLAVARHWSRPARYALFLGDASFDPKNYLGLGNSDFVPTKLIDTLFLETASDDWLADFDRDGISDIAIARLPAQTASEAHLVVSKILSYDESTSADEALLVSDRNDGFNFELANASLIPLLPRGTRVIEIKRALLGDLLARHTLLEAINRGPRLVNYAGHGAVNVWRGNLLLSADGPRLENKNRLSMFVMMNCLNGFFQDPATESLAEALIRSPGGAIAVWASSALTFADGQPVINQEFYRQLFGYSVGPIRIGDAAIRAKRATFDGDVRRTWILFGDPTVSVR